MLANLLTLLTGKPVQEPKPYVNDSILKMDRTYFKSHCFLANLLEYASGFLLLVKECVEDEKALDRYVRNNYGSWYLNDIKYYNPYDILNSPAFSSPAYSEYKAKTLISFQKLLENNEQYSAITSHYMVYNNMYYDIVLENSENIICRFNDIRIEGNNYVCECIDIYRINKETREMTKLEGEHRTLIISSSSKIGIKRLNGGL